MAVLPSSLYFARYYHIENMIYIWVFNTSSRNWVQNSADNLVSNEEETLSVVLIDLLWECAEVYVIWCLLN